MTAAAKKSCVWRAVCAWNFYFVAKLALRRFTGFAGLDKRRAKSLGHLFGLLETELASQKIPRLSPKLVPHPHPRKEQGAEAGQEPQAVGWEASLSVLDSVLRNDFESSALELRAADGAAEQCLGQF